jgi:tetratricopeptide (TPR) repeat protein
MRFKLILSVICSLIGLGILSAIEPDWGVKMQEFRNILSELLPDVISDEEFNSRVNFERIKRNAIKLSMLAHSMPKGELPSDMDPSIGFITSLFKDEALMAQYHLESGNPAYARRILRAIPKYCIACHTRGPIKLELSSQEVPKSFKTPLERAEYFDSTWQFDKALNEFEKAVSDNFIAEKHQIEWQKAAYYGIATAVRVKQDPDRALKFVNLIIDSPSSPQFLRNDALQWQKSLLDWKKEQTQTFETEVELMAEAKRLIDSARTLQKYPFDRDADILYLRATSTLHNFLSKYSDSSNAGEALLLLGHCYEILQDLDLWSLHELYFQACIQKFPHSPVAQACYNRYEESIFAGYSGSGGMSLPPQIQLHLNKLKKLAAPN